jgi:hypothetical protein
MQSLLRGLERRKSETTKLSTAKLVAEKRRAMWESRRRGQRREVETKSLCY